MLRVLLPVLLVLGGLGAGIGAGLALRPEPVAAAECIEDEEGEVCPEEVAETKTAGASDFVPIDKPFVVPVFQDGRLSGMVVLSLSVDVAAGEAGRIGALQPRLRDGFLEVMFRHANSGGFDGTFTQGQKMADLRAGLLAAARRVLDGVPVNGVLVTDIVRQDV